jgi:hypothetical protein
MVRPHRGAFEFYIFHRSDPKVPLYHVTYHREAKPDDDAHIFSFVDVASHLMKQVGTTDAAGTVRAVSTQHYKLHHFATLTGYKFVLMTDAAYPTDDGQELLRQIYDQAFVELVCKDPQFDPRAHPPVKNEAFSSRLRRMLEQRQLLAP